MKPLGSPAVCWVKFAGLSGGAYDGAGYISDMTHAVRITVDVPAPLAEQPASVLAERVRLLLLLDEVRAGRLSRAGAAQALGMPLDEFLILAGRHGLYAIDYDLDDFRGELDALPPRGA